MYEPGIKESACSSQRTQISHNHMHCTCEKCKNMVFYFFNYLFSIKNVINLPVKGTKVNNTIYHVYIKAIEMNMLNENKK